MFITQCTSNYIAIAVLEVIYVDENLRERVYVSYGDFIVSSILNESNAADNVFKPHWHDAFEVLQIYDREIHIEYEGERFTAVPGDMVVFGANAVHAGRTGENGCYYRALQFKWNELLGNTPFEQKCCTICLTEPIISRQGFGTPRQTAFLTPSYRRTTPKGWCSRLPKRGSFAYLSLI